MICENINHLKTSRHSILRSLVNLVDNSANENFNSMKRMFRFPHVTIILCSRRKADMHNNKCQVGKSRSASDVIYLGKNAQEMRWPAAPTICAWGGRR